MASDLPLAISLAAHGATLVVSVVQVYRGKLQPVGPGILTGMAVASQLIDLAARAQAGPPPWQNLSGALLMASLLSAVFLLALRTFLNATGLYAFGSALPFGLLVMGALIRHDTQPAVSAGAVWSQIHVPFAALGLALLGVAAIGAGAYKLKAGRLKARQVGGMAGLLPSLDRLDRIVLVGAFGGFVCLTLSLVTGALWASHGQPVGGPKWHLKEIASLLAWGVYAAYLYMRLVARWQGAWPTALLLTGFVLVGVVFVASGF